MRNLSALGVMLLILLASVGCQQTSLTEEQIRSIVRQEVMAQLSGNQAKDIVGQVVTKQIADVDNIVKQEVSMQLASFDVKDIVQEEVARQVAAIQTRDIVAQELSQQLAKIDVLTVSRLEIQNDDSKTVAAVGSDIWKNGFLSLWNSEGKIALTMDSLTGGRLFIDNSDQNIVAVLMSNNYGDGELQIFNRNSYVTFRAP